MTFIIVFAGWIFSLCLHEFGHAVVAYLGGDYTVKDKGYLTFNPLRYTHPLFSIVLPLIFLLAGGIALPGGAVYIETWRLKNRTWQSLVSLAGPATNLLLAIVLSIVLSFAPAGPYENNNIWPGIAFLAYLQVMALLLNLIPLPPFDGYGILEPFLTPNLRDQINAARMWITLGVFLLLWSVPIVGYLLSTQVSYTAATLGIPLDLAQIGLDRFRSLLGSFIGG
ncbi:MAG: site-2 protease family protein [Chloroflexota bacterium]